MSLDSERPFPSSGSPAAGCRLTQAQLRTDGLMFTSYCPICADDFGVRCRVANHPNPPVAPFSSRVNMAARIKAHRCDALHNALSQDLPFKICCRVHKYVDAFPGTLDVGDCEYDGSVDTFLDYPIVGNSEVAVWSLTNTFLHVLVKCFGGDATLYRNQCDPSSSKRMRPDDAIYYKDAHIIRVVSKTETSHLNVAELTDKLSPNAHLQFPQGSSEILGLCTSTTVARAYRIVYDPALHTYMALPEGSFDLTRVEQRLQFLIFLFKVARWVLTITGPVSRFHLVPGVRRRTPNGNYITFTRDGAGHSCIVKEFSRHREIRFDIMDSILKAHLPNVQWGEVTSLECKAAVLSRVGFTLQQAVQEKLIRRDCAIEHIKSALNQLHGLGYAHCDVKIGNVFVDCETRVSCGFLRRSGICYANGRSCAKVNQNS